MLYVTCWYTFTIALLIINPYFVIKDFNREWPINSFCLSRSKNYSLKLSDYQLPVNLLQNNRILLIISPANLDFVQFQN
jgi:hypothetical protein